MGPLALKERGPLTKALDEPFGVVGLDEGCNRLSQVVCVLEEPGPQTLLLECPDKPFSHSIARGIHTRRRHIREQIVRRLKEADGCSARGRCRRSLATSR